MEPYGKKKKQLVIYKHCYHLLDILINYFISELKLKEKLIKKYMKMSATVIYVCRRMWNLLRFSKICAVLWNDTDMVSPLVQKSGIWCKWDEINWLWKS